jgi:3-phenylpropionate/trans-cinnamate dioxygenase ferredoxin subunit
MATRHVVARTDEIPVGKNKLVSVKGRDIGVFNVKGEFFALADRCPHQGGPLCRGKIVGLAEAPMPGEYRLSRQGEMVKCPWHGWEFDLRTGQSWCDPTHTYVKQYAVAVEPGTEVLKGPYVAETFPVTVEGEYVIVEL